MAWWDDLWLNEGFASWAENLAADSLFPEWCMWDQFTVDSAAAALRLDALRSSHPIQVPIKHAEEVEEVFDAISYCKGSSVVRMIYAVLGHDAFQRGLMAYMKKHKYSNTETYHLWAAWEESSGLPIGDMMKSWTEQMGFPLLTVTSSSFSDTHATINLKQQWFLADGSPIQPGEEKTWCVPILACNSAGAVADVYMMRESTMEIKVPLAAAGDWVKLNAGQQCHLRVCYDAEMLKRLAVGVASGSVTVADRAGVLMDTFAVVKAGHVSPAVLIRLLSNYGKEEDATVWGAIDGVLSGLNTITVENDFIQKELHALAARLVKPLAEKIGWEPRADDGHKTKLLRGTMIGLLDTFCYKDESVVKEVRSRFAKFQENAADMQALPSDMRASVFKMYLKNGGQKEYDQVKAYFETASDTAEKKHVLHSLGAIPDIRLKLQTLDWTTSGAVKLQDFFYTIGSVHRSSKEAMHLTWKYYQDNFERLKGMLGKASPSLMDAVIVFSCGAFCSGEKADEIEAFFAKHPLPSNARKIQQTVESMRANAKFRGQIEGSELSAQAFWNSL